MSNNSIVLTARIEESAGARFTPAGIEVFDARMNYSGQVEEAGRSRTLNFEFRALAFGKAAERLNKVPVGSEIDLKGFIAPASMKNTRLTVHIQDFRLRS